ncbi:mechanosensitive ion channel family protein [Salipiger mangrovisoli]|uniref:Small-conductance mechanosensitive channel n=1 Tax=Salipiger mangrovisoli TaxID=2865933 RepID=A0ABR9X1R3_9RHOB|nr:mechanosensitive ion channel family protein [Salipiger mangrovisoli]MBE9637509.1 mechanosensitive ion channel family protein [Salipiger mangrovisoli]
MDSINEVLNTDIYNGTSLSDVFTLDFLASMLGNVVAAIVLLLVGLFIGRWVKGRITGMSARSARLDDTLFNFLGNIARYTVMIFTILVVLNTFGVQTTSVIAALGAAGLAVGLALQGTLSNVAAGVMIIIFRPIKLGDFISVAGVSGTVKDITLNTTELAGLSNTQIIVPNSEVWGNVIENYSVYQTRRAEWTFGVGYGANLATAERVIRETITSDPRALGEPTPFIQVNALNDSSVDFLVRVWVASADFFQFQADMKRKVKEALDAHGVDIPFPTRTLHISRDDEESANVAEPASRLA